MKTIEARSLVYLSQTKKIRHSINEINKKLDYEYSYLCRTLRSMQKKRWLSRCRPEGQAECFYDLTASGLAALAWAKVFLFKK